MPATASRPLRPATPVHLDAPTPTELAAIVRSIVRVLADSNRTMDIVKAEELSAKAQVRYLRDRVLEATPEGRELLRDRPELSATDVDALRKLPDGTLGREVARFLDRHGLDYHFDDAAEVYLQDPEEAYVLRRYRRTHDLFHVLLDLGITGHEEVLVHTFTLAQMGMPSSVAITLLGAVKHMVLERRWDCLSRGLREAFYAGRRASPLLAVRWESLWDAPLDDVRARYGIEPVRGYAGAA
ncbi:MAG: Coq4 family protein [Polyangiales bacterium]